MGEKRKEVVRERARGMKKINTFYVSPPRSLFFFFWWRFVTLDIPAEPSMAGYNI